MKSKIEKNLRWLVAASLTLGTMPSSPNALAQIYPVSKPETDEAARTMPAEEAAASSKSADKAQFPSGSLAADSALKMPTSDSEEREESDSNQPVTEANAQTQEHSDREKIRETIAAGLKKHLRTDVLVNLKSREIPEGLTDEMMARGGATVGNDKIQFDYLTAEGEIGTGNAPLLRNADGSITIKGVNLEPGRPETPSDTERPVSGDPAGSREIAINGVDLADDKDAAYQSSGEPNGDGMKIPSDTRSIDPISMDPAYTEEKPLVTQSPFSLNDLPAGPMTPYTMPAAAIEEQDPDYTPIIESPEESPLGSGENAALSDTTDKTVRPQAAEETFAALAMPESEPLENVLPQNNGMMSYEEAKKRVGSGEGTIIDIDPKNPSQSPCGGGTQIQSPGGVGPTAWFCPGSNASESSGPVTSDFKPVEETVISTEPLKPETAIETVSDSKPLLNHDGSVWAKPVVFKNTSVEVMADEPSLEIRSLTPSMNREEEAVRMTLSTPVVASFVRAVQSFQQEYKPRSATLSELRIEMKSAYRDVKAIVSEEAQKRIEEAEAEAENKLQDVRAAFDTRKGNARNNALPERNDGRSAGMVKKEIKNALKERIVLIKEKADARVAEFSALYQSADSLIKEYRKAYAAGTPLPLMTAFENNTVFAADNNDSLLG